MSKRAKKILAGIGLLAAFGLGGAAIAAAATPRIQPVRPQPSPDGGAAAGGCEGGCGGVSVTVI